jgi:hypothetical protein
MKIHEKREIGLAGHAYTLSVDDIANVRIGADVAWIRRTDRTRRVAHWEPTSTRLASAAACRVRLRIVLPTDR